MGPEYPTPSESPFSASVTRVGLERVRIDYEPHPDPRSRELVRLKTPPSVSVDGSTNLEEISAEDNVHEIQDHDRAAMIIYTIEEGESMANAAGENYVFTGTPIHAPTVPITTGNNQGYAGQHHAFLGSFTTYTTNNSNSPVTLVVPTILSDTIKDIHAVIDDIQALAHEFQGEHSSGPATIFFSPAARYVSERGFDGGGYASGGDCVVLPRPHDSHKHLRQTTLHEFIHTRQHFGDQLDKPLYWFLEGSTRYLELWTYYKLNGRSSRQLPEDLVNKYNNTCHTAPLNTPENWLQCGCDYRRGAPRVAFIDQHLQHETHGDACLIDIIEALNCRAQNGDTIDAADLQDIFANLAGTVPNPVHHCLHNYDGLPDPPIMIAEHAGTASTLSDEYPIDSPAYRAQTTLPSFNI